MPGKQRRYRLRRSFFECFLRLRFASMRVDSSGVLSPAHGEKCENKFPREIVRCCGVDSSEQTANASGCSRRRHGDIAKRVKHRTLNPAVQVRFLLSLPTGNACDMFTPLFLTDSTERRHGAATPQIWPRMLGLCMASTAVHGGFDSRRGLH